MPDRLTRATRPAWRIFAAAGACALALAAVVAATGGVDWLAGPLRIRVHQPWRLIGSGLALIGLAFWLGGEESRALLVRAWDARERHARWVAAAAANAPACQPGASHARSSALPTCRPPSHAAAPINSAPAPNRRHGWRARRCRGPRLKSKPPVAATNAPHAMAHAPADASTCQVRRAGCVVGSAMQRRGGHGAIGSSRMGSAARFDGIVHSSRRPFSNSAR